MAGRRDGQYNDEMLLDVSRMRSGTHDRFDRTYEAAVFPRGVELYDVVDRVVLGFDVHKDHTRYRLTGRLHTALALSCARCLERFTCRIEAGFDLMYLPHADNTGEGEAEIDEDDLGTAFYRDNIIDLGELLREQFYLALPMKPLCGDACKGLCGLCGANLNTSPCGCETRWVDPRLEGLRALLSRDRGD